MDGKFFQQILLELNENGRSSAKSHIKAALYDWNKENQWNSSNSKIINIDDCAFAFITFTKREPKHCTIRHLVVLEYARNKGYGKKLIHKIKDEMQQRSVFLLRFFADLPSVAFYEKLGFTWHGNSKTGLPFFYGNADGKLVKLPKSQQRYIK